MKNERDIYQYALGTLVALGFFATLACLIFVEMPEKNKEPLLILLGVLGSKFSDVVGYFYNSSKGSADKSEVLNKMQEERQVQQNAVEEKK